MREACHTNEEKLYIIPQDLHATEIEIINKLPKKGHFLAHTAKLNYT